MGKKSSDDFGESKPQKKFKSDSPNRDQVDSPKFEASKSGTDHKPVHKSQGNEPEPESIGVLIYDLAFDELATGQFVLI